MGCDLKNLIQKINNNKLRYLINFFLSVLFLSPLFWTLSTSLKKTSDITTFPPEWIPVNIVLDHYRTIFNFDGGIFTRYLFNSVTVTLFTVLFVTFISSLAGYAFSKLEIPFKNVFKFLILLTLMIPFHALLIPLYSLMNTFNLLDTHLALIIIYVTFQLPFGVFMMSNSFNAIHNSLRESAMLDGASEFQTYLKVFLPLGLPGLATTAVFSAYTTWNDFIIALVFTTSNDMRTLNVGLTNLAIGQYGTNWGLLSSGAVIAIIPIMLLYVFLQKYFVAGLTSGAVK